MAFYVGYFGAGAGFLFMTMLSSFGYEDIHDINALKVLANLMANGVAFLIFVVDGQVVWRFCLLAMVVCAIGGYSSARFARADSTKGAARPGGRHRAVDGGMVLLEKRVKTGNREQGLGIRKLNKGRGRPLTAVNCTHEPRRHSLCHEGRARARER